MIDLDLRPHRGLNNPHPWRAGSRHPRVDCGGYPPMVRRSSYANEVIVDDRTVPIAHFTSQVQSHRVVMVQASGTFWQWHGEYRGICPFELDLVQEKGYHLNNGVSKTRFCPCQPKMIRRSRHIPQKNPTACRTRGCWWLLKINFRSFYSEVGLDQEESHLPVEVWAGEGCPY